MFSINLQLSTHIKDFRLLTPRQPSFYQLRLSVFKQPTLKNKVFSISYVNEQTSQQLIPYLILTPQINRLSFNQSIMGQSIHNKDQDSSITGRYIPPHHRQQTQPAILTSSQQNNKMNTSYNRINSLQVEYNNNINNKNPIHTGEIDSQTNSYLTKPFLVQKTDHVIDIDEVVVFKGTVEIGVGDFMEVIRIQQEQKVREQQYQQKNIYQQSSNTNNTRQQPKLSSTQLSHLLTSLFVSCQLFLVNSYSTESIGQWAGYTLNDQGNVLLPVSYFAYNSSYSLMEITFLWTKIEFLPNGKENTLFIGKSGQEHVQKITQYLESKYQHLANKVLNLPQQYTQNVKNPNFIHHHNGHFIKRKDSTNTSNPLQHLLHTLSEFNQQTHILWKAYQQYFQQTILSRGKLKHIVGNINEQKLSHYKQSLKLYHWKYHVQINYDVENNNLPTIKKQQQSKSRDNKQFNKQQQTFHKKLQQIKANLSIDRQLSFYPFQQHNRILKINTQQDLIKISKINSLTLSQSKSNHSLLLSQNKQTKPKYHLLIFVHGYQASSYDMQNLACYLKYKQPQKIRTFISSCNQGRTQQPIEESGHRLAIEIKNFINNKFEHDKEQIEISFICHSMGGLIVRAALKYLQLYKNKFKTYLSLCSPHLGYLYHTSALIKTSLWVLNQVKKDPSMIELSMQDNPVLQKTYLYQLSKKPELQWFKYPIFIGSRQDEYVPFWSALVQDKQFFFETKDAKIYKELYKNFTEHIENKIIRLQTLYQDKINDISSFVGRTAHIRILNCIEIMEIIYLLVEGAF